MSSSNLVRIGYKKEIGDYGVTPVATKASKIIGGITLTSVKGGEQGNLFSVEKVDDVSAGNELVVITGKKITIHMEDGVSTATQINTALTTANAALATLGVSFAITGTAGAAQNLEAEAYFTGGAGSFKTARFTSEKYSGTPDTTESSQIRTDRMSSGQIVTGLKVDGGHSFELAKEKAIEDFMESAMFNHWITSPEKAATLEIDMLAVAGPTLIRSAGNFINDGVVVGDFIKLGSFVAGANNVVVMAMIVGPTTIVFAHPPGVVSAAAEAATFQICDKLSIGIEKHPFTIEKTYLDLTNKALIYRGVLVGQMELSVEYGALVTGSFDTQGNDYVAADDANEFASYNEFFEPSATSNSMNGSVDMPFVATDVTGTWDQDAFCLQKLDLQLNNNLTVQNCIGKAAPEDYSPGTAAITANLSSYLKDGNWGMLAKKLNQQSFAIGFMTQNVDGYYGFYIPAIQVSFDDPSSGGANQEISMDMKGTAKVGAGGQSALSIYRAPTA